MNDAGERVREARDRVREARKIVMRTKKTAEGGFPPAVNSSQWFGTLR
jgi:hypothetical protein